MISIVLLPNALGIVPSMPIVTIDVLGIPLIIDLS